ncbi:hypothetical protein QSJ18_16530 [Gordonia sp. ABSL1-1]|uniref:hypothetical protein n=1 Tax=Gordonia sp. ABSL1-1 TaxID=3053923 RepID=UPI0025727AB3|nr:hypothetical protein [Gordonia sp. ABSL1-1]MDL9938359.1 hypothetical protein [Gordonia sp. ABSL1-1]
MNTVTNLSWQVAVLADQEPKGPEFGKASPIGLLLIVLLLAATAFLIWSMNRQLKKLPKTFDSENPAPDQAFDEGTDSQGATSPADTSPADTSPADTSPADTDHRKSADT